MSKVCEATVVVVRGDQEEELMENVAVIRQEGDQLVLRGLFGEQQTIKARIKEVHLVDHKVLLEE